MSIIYIVSVILLLTTVMIVKKSEKKMDFIVTMTISIVLLLCYNTLICYIFTMCNIPINLITLTIPNFIITIILGIIIFHSKQIQAYQVNYKDVLAIILIVALIFLIVCLQYGIPLNIKYIMTDAAAHYASSEEFYQRETLLLKAEGITVGRYMMPGAYSNSGILFKVFAPYIGEMNLYNIFILFDIFILTLSGILMYLNLKKRAKTDLQLGMAIIISILYLLGYPLNSMLFGYSYLSVGIVIIATILLFIQYFQEEKYKNLVNISVLFLLCTQIFFSYYLFVPAVYGTLGIYYILHFRKKHNKIWNKEMIVYASVTLVIPALIGLSYHIFPQMVSFVPTQLMNGIKDEGYIYRNMITNLILLIPFSIYYIYKQIKEKKIDFITLFAVIFVLYTIIVYFAMVKGIISTYFFYKLHFILWMIMWMLCYRGINTIEKEVKMGDIIVKTYMLCYVGLFIVALLTSNVAINKSKNTNEKITDVMDIYGINKTLMFRTEVDLSTEEIEILKQVKQNNVELADNNTLILANQRQEYWIWAIFKYNFKQDLYHATTMYYINKWNNDEYEYIIILNDSENGKIFKKYLDLGETEIIFQNESGAIIKNIGRKN
ncbi:MAG: hypothetical protein J6A04_00045 [Clostridia bacterium]|nr:hypothetical protein [Clostridia bacterium]